MRRAFVILGLALMLLVATAGPISAQDETVPPTTLDEPARLVEDDSGTDDGPPAGMLIGLAIGAVGLIVVGGLLVRRRGAT